MSVLAIIQARLGSTRLPGKVLLNIGKFRLIQHVLLRAREIEGIADIVLAVPEGEVLPAYWLHVADPSVPDADVLARFVWTTQYFDHAHDTIMRITGDCPLFAPDLAERVLELYALTRGCEYAWIDTRKESHGWPDGVDVEVFSRDALLWAHREATDPADREHVTPWIRRHCKTVALPAPADYSHLKLSVDTAEDLARVRAIAAKLPPYDYRFETTVKAAEACLIPATS